MSKASKLLELLRKLRGGKPPKKVPDPKGKFPDKKPCATQSCAPKQPGPGVGGKGTASEFGSMQGMSRSDADAFLRSRGAEVRTTEGGYTRYRFPDKSEVWLRPNGEVVRLPKPEYAPSGARINKGVRLGENGAPTTLHNTGERVID